MAAAEKEVQEAIDTPEPTLREQLESARDEAVARQTEQPNEQSTTETGAQAGEEAAVRKARDAQGRFTSATAVDGNVSQGNRAASANKPGDQSVVGANTPAVSAPSTQPVNDAPQSWTAAEKTLWASIPAPARAVIQRREADVHKAIAAHDEVRNIGNEFMRTAAQYAPVVQRTGMTPAQLWSQYLETVRMVQTADPQQRAAIFRDLAVRNGADISGHGSQNVPQGNPPSQGAQPVHPMLMSLAQQVQTMKREQDEYKQREEQSRQAREQAEMQETASEIEVFRSKPENTHFDAVKDLMASILRGGAAQTLEEAYNIAVKAHPQVSVQLEQEQKAAAQKAAADKAKLDLARRKAGSIRSGPGGITPSAQTGSIREELQKAFAESRSRV